MSHPGPGPGQGCAAISICCLRPSSLHDRPVINAYRGRSYVHGNLKLASMPAAMHHNMEDACQSKGVSFRRAIRIWTIVYCLLMLGISSSSFRHAEEQSIVCLLITNVYVALKAVKSCNKITFSMRLPTMTGMPYVCRALS